MRSFCKSFQIARPSAASAIGFPSAGKGRGSNPCNSRKRCNVSGRAWAVARCLAALSVFGMCLLGSASCSRATRTVSVGVAELEGAAAVAPENRARAIVNDPAALGASYQPLGKRMGLVQVRSCRQWDALRAAASELGPCPDLSQGIAIAIVSRAGIPIDGEWPISLDDVRVSQGAGLVRADFHAGTYLPDGTTYLEIAQVPGLSDVLMVDIDGVRFFP